MDRTDQGFVAFFVVIFLVLAFFVHKAIEADNAFDDRCHKAGGHVVDQYKSNSLCFIDGKLAFSE